MGFISMLYKIISILEDPQWLQIIISVIALIFAFFAWRGLRKEEKDRANQIFELRKQTAGLEILVNHTIKSRRNSILPYFKKDGLSQNQDSTIFNFKNKGKKAYKLSYKSTDNEVEFCLCNVPPIHDLDINQVEHIHILFKKTITQPIRIIFEFYNEDSEKYIQEANIISKNSFTIDSPRLVLEKNNINNYTNKISK